jgi:hypothetical protein
MIGFARPKAALRIRASLDVARKPFRQSAADNICGEDQADRRALGLTIRYGFHEKERSRPLGAGASQTLHTQTLPQATAG